MIINTVLLLATLFAATNQEHRSMLPFQWQTHGIYKDDCPLNKELYNPFNTYPQPSSDTICLCDGTYQGKSRERYNHGPYHECPQLAQQSSMDDIDTFLLCWTKLTHAPENRYSLMVPVEYSYKTLNKARSFYYEMALYDTIKITPLFHKKHPNALKTWEHDPRCNLKKWQKNEQLKIKEQKREHQLQRRDTCSYRGRGYKKNHR